MNRHWMGGAKKRVTERRGSKVERQQRAYFESRRRPGVQHRSTPTKSSALRVAAIPPSTTTPPRPSTYVAAPVYEASSARAAPPHMSLDLLMLSGPCIHLTTKKRHLFTTASDPTDTNEAPDTANDAPDAVPASILPAPIVGRPKKKPRQGALAEAAQPASSSTEPPQQCDLFKVPTPKSKPNYFLSAVSQPLHKVRFFDEGTERTDEEYLKDEAWPDTKPAAARAQPRLTYEKAQKKQLAPLSPPLSVFHFDTHRTALPSASSGSYFLDAGLDPVALYDDTDVSHRHTPPSFYRLSATEE